MRHISKSMHLHEVLRRNVDGGTELVCFSVIHGRGNGLRKRHITQEELAAELTHAANTAYGSLSQIAALIDAFDRASFDSKASRRQERKHLLQTIRRIAKGVIEA